jgi:2-polyprenyl-6-methoxyphenol hydroxylase-like FAD-dependent oxidoreductase
VAATASAACATAARARRASCAPGAWRAPTGCGPPSGGRLAIPLRTWGDDQRYVVGIGPRPVELEDGAALVYHGTGYADGVMPLGQNGYFYDGVTPANRAAVDAGDLDGWRAIYSERVPYAAELTAAPRSWDDLSVLGTRPGRVRRRIAAGAALLGDAAASVHPHSAQGANLALEDAVALGELLATLDPARELRRGDLEAYQRRPGRKGARHVAWSRFAGGSFDGQDGALAVRPLVGLAMAAAAARPPGPAAPGRRSRVEALPCRPRAERPPGPGRPASSVDPRGLGRA